MNQEEIRTKVLEALRDVAPEADPATIDPDRPLRDQLDIDSYDLLQFLLGVHQRLGVDIPEADYGQIPTLGRLISYLETRLQRPA